MDKTFVYDELRQVERDVVEANDGSRRKRSWSSR